MYQSKANEQELSGEILIYFQALRLGIAIAGVPDIKCLIWHPFRLAIPNPLIPARLRP